MIGLETYANKTKWIWRKQVINELISRIRDRKNSICIGLPSSEDFDRKVLCQKGFKPDNLIGVEIDQNKVNLLRKAGKNIIFDLLEKVIISWPDSPNVSMIIGDFCCGLKEEILDLVMAVTMKKAFEGCAVLLNLQRGREKFFHEQTENMKETVREINDSISEVLLSQTIDNLDDLAKKHGKSKNWVDEKFAVMEKELQRLKNEEEDVLAEKTKHRGKLVIKALSNFPVEDLSPKYYSYRSRKVIMDSVIFTVPREQEPGDVPWEHYKEEIKPYMDQETKRKINAALAIRTMRLNGTLSHSPRA